MTTAASNSSLAGVARRRKRTALIENPVPALDAFLALVRAHDHARRLNDAAFAQAGVTAAQYNLLRSLYVQDEGTGLPCAVLGERMLSRVPDVTRLVDRLAARGLLERKRSQKDRRVVLVHLTDEGVALVERIHQPMLDSHTECFEVLSERELASLTRLLRKVAAG